MSHLLEFSPTRPLPHNINSPPYVVFGIYGLDITSSLPPHIPLNLALHFAPALGKWTLPVPDPTYLPRSVARQCLRTPYIGIDIFASIEAVGLGWIIMRMLHLGGRKVGRDMFGVHPDLATSLAIHNAWLALELPIEGLRGLHMHIHAQLMLSSPPVSLWDMRMLWDTFPHTSEIVRAMGLNFIEGYVNVEYKVNESLEIVEWFQSTPELYAFFKSLQDAVPEAKEKKVETVTVPAAEENEKAFGTGYKTVGRKAGKAIKAALAKEAAGQVGIMERAATWKVSPQERQEREASDFEAMRMRLRRTRSDDSLRSVDTAIWDPQTPEQEIEEEDVLVSDDLNDPSNYSGGFFSVALARTLESIRIRREARNPKSKASAQPPTEGLASANLMRHSVENQPVFQIRAATTPQILQLLNDWEGMRSVHRRPGEANPSPEGEVEHTGARS
ncbi:hypothetical protein BU25DRAFT_405325 [Macroventuria anomochaeta]|uniref:Uncharacterized protein n=1 Tax=Macroventuria anomochaeta TaxID=301207 RepID=A0ACB6SGX9_9PLEO|nr:uncharacterized protein BU25DRAFT_405325 [Macroventuria anomochaeta]KAF2633431.1 hypothetical protein BU25DRAFT_405325 [Macroventuria anomochaeta]